MKKGWSIFIVKLGRNGADGGRQEALYQMTDPKCATQYCIAAINGGTGFRNLRCDKLRHYRRKKIQETLKRRHTVIASGSKHANVHV